MSQSFPTSLLALTLAGCGSSGNTTASASAGASEGSDTASVGSAGSAGSTEPTTGASGTTTSGSTSANTVDPDLPMDSTGGAPACATAGGCHRLDILLVVDNSSDTAPKQDVLASSLPHLVQKLRALTDVNGASVEPDVNVMVTTTDVGFPSLCDVFQPLDYEPAVGRPVSTPCTERLEHFDWNNANLLEVCTDHCPPGQSAAPVDPFVHFAGDNNNVDDPDGIGDPVADALACLAPQGIKGCGLEAPLEAMRLALAPDAPWNQPPAPFLREGAALAIIVVTDETDCSAEDDKYFDPDFQDHPEFGKYWYVDPVSMQKLVGTGAVCWNAGMACDDVDMDGVYEACSPEEQDALFDLSRYTDLLREQLDGRPVFMLLLAGIPTVTAHNPDVPHQPTAGGVLDLVYRDWTDADILPNDDDTPAEKQSNYGIGPGCGNAAIGQATPPGRIREVCEALDLVDEPATPADEAEVRCCIESVCDPDYTAAFDCLTGMLSQRLRAAP